MAYCGLITPPLCSNFRQSRSRVRTLLALFPERDQVLEHVLDVADDRQVDHDVLVDRAGVDVDVDLLGAGRELVQPAGHPVVETRADVDHDVAAVHGEIGLVGAVHAQHAEELRVRAREGAEAHERAGAGRAGHVHQLAQQAGGLRPGVDHAAAGIDDRALGPGDHLDRRRHLVGLGPHLWPVAAVLDLVRRDVVARRLQHVLGQVDDHRTRPAVGRHVDGLVQDARQVLDRLDQIVVLGAGPGDAGGVGLLEGVVADQVGRYLPGQADQRDRVHQRVGQAGHRVGGPRPGGHQDGADPAGRTRIALGRVDRALLVAHQDVAQRILLEQRIVDRQHRAAGIAEDHVDALVQQGADHHGRSGHLLASHLPRIPSNDSPRVKKTPAPRPPLPRQSRTHGPSVTQCTIASAPGPAGRAMPAPYALTFGRSTENRE
jgi:hypothetical protein